MKKFIQMLLNTIYNLEKELNEKNLELQKLDDEEWFQAELTGYKLWRLEEEQKKYENKNTYINDEKYRDWNPTNSKEIDDWWFDYHSFGDSEEFIGLDFSDVYSTQIRVYQDEEDMAHWDEEVQRLNELAYLQDFYAEHIEKIKAQKTLCDKLAYYISQPIDQLKTDKKPVSVSCLLESLQMETMNRMEKQLKEQKDEIDDLYEYIDELRAKQSKIERSELLAWCKEVSNEYLDKDNWWYNEDEERFEYIWTDEDIKEENLKYTLWDYYPALYPYEREIKQNDYAPWAEFLDDPEFYSWYFDIYSRDNGIAFYPNYFPFEY